MNYMDICSHATKQSLECLFTNITTDLFHPNTCTCTCTSLKVLVQQTNNESVSNSTTEEELLGIFKVCKKRVNLAATKATEPFPTAGSQ